MTISDLARSLGQIEPDALLVSPRLLRRVIKRDRQIPGLGLRVPHARGYTLSRDALLACVQLHELGQSPGTILPEIVLLLPMPAAHELRPDRQARTLLTLSRRLMHEAIHRAIRSRNLSAVELAERIARIGEAAWEEIRGVLLQERLLLPPCNSATIYEEFASVFLELAYHAEHQLERWFPALKDRAAVRAMLEADIGDVDLGQRTLLPGTPKPETPCDDAPREAEVMARPRTMAPAGRMLVEAKAAALRSNFVRAAILRTRAGASDLACENVRQLVARLTKALDLVDALPERWEHALRPLLAPAAAGWWTRAARLLYDLQTTCEDRERPFFAVDLVEWITRWGGPLKRPLPNHGEVRACRSLRRALRRVAGLPLTPEERAALYDLLAQALHEAEEAVRRAFAQALEDTLRAVGFVPQNHAEELARKKVVGELLEVVVEQGHLNLGHLRDAIARNRLKLGDLASPGEAILGDAMLQANARLAVRLDGVYHRGELYLRWLQSLSSLTFGTRLGRWLTLFLVLPFLGSFLLLKFAEEIAHFFTKAEIFPDESLFIGAAFLLLLIHWPAFRWLLGVLLWQLGAALRWLFFGLPHAVLRWPPVQAILQSRAFNLALQVILKPLAVAVGGIVIAWFLVPTEVLLAVFVGTFVLALAVLNSPYGLYLEEIASDGVLRTWTLIREDLLVGVVGYLMAMFRRLIEEVDRLFYTVDEWLRFRSGESGGSLVLKTILGSIWWAITYLFRFAFVVLIEPQINPIKHFPVVTVGHKVLLLAIDPTARALEQSFGIAYLEAAGAVTIVFALIPGIFGFLAWELLANWRLYRANQPTTLGPVRVGSHGETVRGLLRPGFHSGTIPKLFAYLRHLPESLESPRLHRTHAHLHHCAEAMAQFVRRDLLDALRGTKMWRDRVVLTVGQVQLDTRRIRVPIHAAGETSPLILVFEQAGPWLLFRVDQRGWVEALRNDLVPLWRDALIGFCKHAGVQLTLPQLTAALPPDTTFRLDEAGLEVQREGVPLAIYDLNENPTLSPRDEDNTVVLDWPELTPTMLRFDAHPVTWEDWVKVWKTAQKGSRPNDLLPGLALPGCP